MKILRESSKLLKKKTTTSEKLRSAYQKNEQKIAEKIANQGQRVLAFGLVDVDDHVSIIARKDIDTRVQLLGMVGLIDPPREEAIQAIKECYSAGINVKMITGDHAGTALAIAKKIGLKNSDTAFLGKDIDTLSDSDLQRAVKSADVFARTSPEHKLRLVHVYKEDENKDNILYRKPIMWVRKAPSKYHPMTSDSNNEVVYMYPPSKKFNYQLCYINGKFDHVFDNFTRSKITKSSEVRPGRKRKNTPR